MLQLVIIFSVLLIINNAVTNAQLINSSISGFSISLLYPSLNRPMSFCFHPTDGRTLIILKGGKILVTPCCVTNQTQMNVFLDVSLTSRLSTVGDGGLFSATFDPFDSVSKYIYVQYLQRSPTLASGRADRVVVSRFTIDPSNSFSALSESEQVLFLHIVNVRGQINHFGGGLVFGSDGLLYSSTGVASLTPYTMAQDLASTAGKIVRIDKDGVTIPSQNPFFTTSGAAKSIFALGFRNPYTLSRSLESNDIYISDVGEKSFEEINVLVKGANYGWPEIEGFQKQTSLRTFTNPILAYPHEGSGNTVRGCCIVGTVEYRVSRTFDAFSSPFPSSFQGKIFYSELCGGWINMISGTNSSTRFASGFKSPMSIGINPYDGGMYIATETGDIYKIIYNAARPPQYITIVTQPKSLTVFSGDLATFTVKVSTTTLLNIRWQMMRVGAARTWLTSTSAFGESLTFLATEQESGNAYRAVIFKEDNTTIVSDVATLTVNPSPSLVAVIDSTTIGTSYFAGKKFNIKGYLQSSLTGQTIPASHTYAVTLKHGFHTHSLFSSIIGSPESPLPFTFTAPITGEFDFNQSLLISFQATTAGGLSFSSSKDLLPVPGYLKLKTFPPGLKIAVNGELMDSPYEIKTVAGMVVQIGPPPGKVCLSWTDGGFGVNGTRMYAIPLLSANRIITIKLL